MIVRDLAEKFIKSDPKIMVCVWDCKARKDIYRGRIECASGDYFNPEDVYPYIESDNLNLVEVALEELSESCEPKSMVIDNVNSPNHYQFNGIETIDYINGVTSEIQDGYEGYLVGNILKYVSRYPKKNGVEDLRKAENYLKKLIEKLEK